MAVIWRSRGREGCTANVSLDKKPNGDVHVTCSGCSLNYTVTN